MNLPRNIPCIRRQAGVLLVECLVYIAVFGVLLGGGTAVFYFCWDHTQAMVYTTDEITSALHAGERWRADVRAATTDGTTPLHAFARLGNAKDALDMCALVLDRGADVDARDSKGNTPLLASGCHSRRR